jgi:hypothetical protein
MINATGALHNFDRGLLEDGLLGSRMSRAWAEHEPGLWLTARTVRSMLLTNDGTTAQNSRPKRHQIPEMMVCIGCRH